MQTGQNHKKDIYILGIESSCDDTSCAVIKNERRSGPDGSFGLSALFPDNFGHLETDGRRRRTASALPCGRRGRSSGPAHPIGRAAARARRG